MKHEISFFSPVRASAALFLTIGLSFSAVVPAAAENTSAQTILTGSLIGREAELDWSALTVAQQQALAPLSADWSHLDSAHKKKWLAIGNKFPSMKPEERTRIQNRMREWIKLSPQQRRIARENYWRAKKINPDQKSVHWQEYQRLSEEQKKTLAATAAANKKRVVRLPKTHKNNDAAPSTPQKMPLQSAPTQNKDSSILTPSAPPIDTK